MDRRPPWRRVSSRPSSSLHNYGDRFIPNRAATNMDIAQGLLTIPKKEKSTAVVSPSREAYRKLLADILLQGRTHILSFHNQPRTTVQSLPDPPEIQLAWKRRHIPKQPELKLDARELIGDCGLNLLDWGSSNILSIALGNTVCLWNAEKRTSSLLAKVDDVYGPVTSVRWHPDGHRIAIGLNNSDVQVWDATYNKRIRTLSGIHQDRVGSLAWNDHLLTTGGRDGAIINNDVRTWSHTVSAYRDHEDEVCGLKWCQLGNNLASGGNDKLLHIWDLRFKSTPIHRLNKHTAAVRALAWSPFQHNLLASGGGETDQCIKFWNASDGTCLYSVDTRSQVCGLLWNENERELLSSHGLTQNQLTLWKYPSMYKMAELTAHTSPVLYMAQSPDGCTVASASADEKLRLWLIFGDPKTIKRKYVPKTTHLVGLSNRCIR